MATGNSSGGDKGYEDLCNTLCPEEMEPLMSAEGRAVTASCQ